ncbi:hypothetical protein Tco_0191141 [Tanacetum coccineum]
MLVNALRRFRESLRRVTDGTEASCLTYIVLLFLDKLDTDLAQSKVTPLFDTMLVQPTQDEGASSERLSDEQPSPSPAPTSEVPNESLPDSSSAQPSEVPFEQQPDPSPSPFPRLLPKSSPTPIVLDSIPETTVSIASKIPRKKLLKERAQRVMYPIREEDEKEDGNAKENAQSEGRSREMVDDDKEIEEKVSTDRPIVSTDRSKVSTDEQVEGTDEQVEGTEEIFESTEEQREGTEEIFKSTKEQRVDLLKHPLKTPTSMIFGDDETIATLLLNMSQAKAASKEKEKGVELKDVEEIDRPRPTSTRSLLTLKPLPKIDPKDKGKKKIEEEDESEIQEEWEAEEERNRIAEEKATNEALIKNFDDIKARIEADRILAEKLQEQEREQFTIEERAKFLHDTIAAQRKFLAQQRSEAIRNKTPPKNQLRNQMMTYLSLWGTLNILVIPPKEKRIKQESKEEVKKEDKDEESTRKKKTSDKENDELRLYLTIAQDEEKEVDYEILDRKFPIKECKTEYYGTKPQEDLMMLYQLVMDKYQDEMPEGFDRVYWGDLMVLFNPDEQNEFWNSQHDWIIVSWKLHSSSESEGYHLKKEIVMQMLKLKLESEEESTMALEFDTIYQEILADLELTE